jgi:hypothetical protein
METVCFSGKCPEMSREELEKKAWKQFDVHSTLTKKVDILVCEDVDSGTEKVEKAKRYGTKIMNYYDFLELLDGGDRAQSKKEEAKQKKKKQIDFAIAKAFFDVIVQEHSLKNMKVEYGAKEFYLVIPTKDGGVEVCLESAKAEKWRQTLPAFLDLAINGATEKELRGYMAEKKLSDASKYRLKISKYGELKGLRSTATYLVIPDNVVEICEWAFSFNNSLLSVVIPSSVTAVEERAFQDCKNLKSVVICDGVKIIGEGAFYGCHSLESVTIPSSVERIFTLTFTNSGIKSVVIPESVCEIHREAFYYCFSLTEITFRGTKSQWEKVSKGDKWNYCVPAKVVHCSDGDAELTGAAE